MRRRAAAALLLIALAGLAGAERASAIAITGTVTGGATLSASSTGSPSFSLTLNGTDQTASYTLPAQAVDPRGTGAGWNLTVTSTQFSDGSGHAFPTTASSITAASNACGTSSTCTTATNSVSYASLTVPAGPTAPAAVKFFNAGTNTGMGKIDVSATVSVAVPANVFAGTYTSTVTVSVVSGP
jgi:hypothetical protein